MVAEGAGDVEGVYLECWSVMRRWAECDAFHSPGVPLFQAPFQLGDSLDELVVAPFRVVRRLCHPCGILRWARAGGSKRSGFSPLRHTSCARRSAEASACGAAQHAMDKSSCLHGGFRKRMDAESCCFCCSSAPLPASTVQQHRHIYIYTHTYVHAKQSNRSSHPLGAKHGHLCTTRSLHCGGCPFASDQSRLFSAPPSRAPISTT